MALCQCAFRPICPNYSFVKVFYFFIFKHTGSGLWGVKFVVLWQLFHCFRDCSDWLFHNESQRDSLQILPDYVLYGNTSESVFNLRWSLLKSKDFIKNMRLTKRVGSTSKNLWNQHSFCSDSSSKVHSCFFNTANILGNVFIILLVNLSYILNRIAILWGALRSSHSKGDIIPMVFTEGISKGNFKSVSQLLTWFSSSVLSEKWFTGP